jgi:hypothetical protein
VIAIRSCLVLALGGCVALNAWAQAASAPDRKATSSGARKDAVFGMPVVGEKGAWARYRAATSDNRPAEPFIRIVGPGNRKGKTGTWVAFEVQPPGIGLVSTHFLVLGRRATYRSIVQTRGFIEGQEQPTPPDEKPGDLVADRGTADEETAEDVTVKGKVLHTKRHRWKNPPYEIWICDEVPGLGIVRVGGDSAMELVDFGATPK